MFHEFAAVTVPLSVANDFIFAQFLVNRELPLGKTAENHHFRQRFTPVAHRVDGDPRRGLFRKTVRSGGNRRKRHTAATEVCGNFQTIDVTVAQKFRFSRRDGEPLYLAAVWDRRDGMDCYCIITTAADEDVAPVHQRMPLVLRREQLDRWLRSEAFPAELLEGPPPQLLRIRADGQLGLW